MGNQISLSDKIISALTYLTGGLAGIIWQIFCVVTKRPMSKFLLFNIFQSIFLGIFLFLLNIIITLAVGLLVIIPGVRILVNYLNLLLSTPVIYNLSVVGLIIFVVYLYMIVFSLMGRCAYIPWVSKIIEYQINRY